MPIEKDGKLIRTYDELKLLAGLGEIVDGTLEGLILGNSHSDGGIKVIRQYLREVIYRVIAEYEGWAYILNPVARVKEKDYLTEINSKYVDTKRIIYRLSDP